MLQEWDFPYFQASHDFFFKNLALSLLYPYRALTSCKILEKTDELSLEYLKTDQKTDGRTSSKGDYYGPHQSGKPWV